MTSKEFERMFGTEKKCEAFIKSEREKRGLFCPNCNSKVTNWRPKCKYWRCKCGKKISLKSGTIFQSSKLKFTVWFKAIFLMSQTKKSYSSLAIAQILRINREETVWYLMMKIRTAMFDNLLENKYTEFYYVLSPKSEEKKNIKALKYHSVVAVDKSGRSGEDKIFLMAPIKHCQDVFALERGLIASGYRYRKILGIQDRFHRCEGITAIRSSTVKWIKIITENSNKMLDGIHHGVTEIHLQKYMIEFSFKYNHRNTDKFSALLYQALE